MLTNHFAELSSFIAPSVMQIYIVVMILMVIGGTLYDVAHKRSAKYFSRLQASSLENGTRQVGGGEKMGIAIKTAVVDVATSGEFCNPMRRIAHLLTMYGFVVYLLMTLILVFGYMAPGGGTPGILVLLWYLGALMVCVGGYWFWFFIRVDVAAEGQSPFRLVRADLFVLSLLASCTTAVIWGIVQSTAGGDIAIVFLILYLASTTVLFGTVAWSKFAHMFFKPAAAFHKRMSYANGSAMNLPTVSRDDPAQRERHSMELLRDAPMDMGLGIKREQPNHY